MGQLSQLLVLSISNNMIRGPLPQEMSSLFNLQIINLSFNEFNFSSIPQWLLRLPSLSRIYMAGCGIQGEMPESLKIMPSSIQELDLSVNHLTGNLSSWLGTLTQLYLLNLSRNSLVSDVPKSITQLNALGVLDLHSNKLTGNIGQVFKMEHRFPQGPLTYIDLSDNRFTEGIEQIGIGAQCGVQFLNLSCNFFPGRLPTTIGMCTSLQSLDLSNNNLGFNLPDALANLSLLEVLKLQRNQLTGSIPEGFLKLSKLRELNLSDNLLVGQIPAGKPLTDFPESSFSGNRGLCGKPLNPCKL